ncbi:hypothetical protein FVE85_3205 [Porphyridium purpureum]|uniref:Condensin II complex subunit H2 N-terminal domain-containing protein n=1 Tax=Porphyridium purpureum TaxID=35688 RepID=A0A5J4YW65_PORPP|nr:hypothetical protein FVE85_3205 [Porphyridium purpureum]|eukprot:POR0743..scf227_4
MDMDVLEHVVRGCEETDDVQLFRENFEELLGPIGEISQYWQLDLQEKMTQLLGLFNSKNTSQLGAGAEFQRAALVVQGSARLYARKVDHAYDSMFGLVGYLQAGEDGSKSGDANQTSQRAQKKAERRTNTCGLAFFTLAPAEFTDLAEEMYGISSDADTFDPKSFAERVWSSEADADEQPTQNHDASPWAKLISVGQNSGFWDQKCVGTEKREVNTLALDIPFALLPPSFSINRHSAHRKLAVQHRQKRQSSPERDSADASEAAHFRLFRATYMRSTGAILLDGTPFNERLEPLRLWLPALLDDADEEMATSVNARHGASTESSRGFDGCQGSADVSADFDNNDDYDDGNDHCEGPSASDRQENRELPFGRGPLENAPSQACSLPEPPVSDPLLSRAARVVVRQKQQSDIRCQEVEDAWVRVDPHTQDPRMPEFPCVKGRTIRKLHARSPASMSKRDLPTISSDVPGFWTQLYWTERPEHAGHISEVEFALGLPNVLKQRRALTHAKGFEHWVELEAARRRAINHALSGATTFGGRALDGRLEYDFEQDANDEDECGADWQVAEDEGSPHGDSQPAQNPSDFLFDSTDTTSSTRFQSSNGAPTTPSDGDEDLIDRAGLAQEMSNMDLDSDEFEKRMYRATLSYEEACRRYLQSTASHWERVSTCEEFAVQLAAWTVQLEKQLVAQNESGATYTSDEISAWKTDIMDAFEAKDSSEISLHEMYAAPSTSRVSQRFLCSLFLANEGSVSFHVFASGQEENSVLDWNASRFCRGAIHDAPESTRRPVNAVSEPTAKRAKTSTIRALTPMRESRTDDRLALRPKPTVTPVKFL